jgi:CheY-like chemotaxis protein
VATILVVDDDPAVRGILRKCFESEKHDVETASDGLEALTLVNDHSFDAAFVDIAMPNVDGLTLMRRLVQDRPETSLVVMSGFEDLRDLAEREFGPRMFLSKPFALDEARVALGVALGTGGSARQPTSEE